MRMPWQARKINLTKATLSQIIAWVLVCLVVAASILAWTSSYQWHILPLSTYEVFPVLGLLAFGLLWTTYTMTALGSYWSLGHHVLAQYFKWTGYAILALICLHPGLLIYQRFQDGYGLPPHSYESYVAPGLGWVTLLGTVSLFIFLAFELRRFFGKYSWWHYVADASDLAMLFIAYHGLTLGNQVQIPWFKTIWWFYIVSLAFVLVYKYRTRLRTKILNDKASPKLVQ